MATKSIEEKIQSLEKIIKKQQHELERQAAINEVQNLMNRYEWLLGTGHVKEVVDMFALKTPGVRAEMVWGIYEGAEGIKKLYLDIHGEVMKIGKMPGGLAILTNTTSVIEIAGDGKTAKAVWICPGIDTGTYGQGGKPRAHWAWARRAADFVKEDGKWKIWHYTAAHGIFFSPFEKSWVEGSTHPSGEMPPGLQPNRPPRKSPWFYSPEAIWELDPVPPEPYNTFDEKTAY